MPRRRRPKPTFPGSPGLPTGLPARGFFRARHAARGEARHRDHSPRGTRSPKPMPAESHRATAPNHDGDDSRGHFYPVLLQFATERCDNESAMSRV
jgi:hypothetical protein